MTEMPVRARRRLEDVAVNWHERSSRHDEIREQQANRRRRRMTCSASLSAYTQNQDWTGSLGLSFGGSILDLKETKGKKKILSREGIRWDIAWIAIGLLSVLLVFILLSDLSGIGKSLRNISKLSTRIGIITEKNEQLDAELSMSTDDLSVCMEAVKLNLIGSGGARTVRLTAPTSATMKVTAAATQNGSQMNQGD